jgi:hypothetical protein
VSIVGSAEAKDDVAKEPELERTVMLPKNLSPSMEVELPKVTKAPATSPKRRRMASVLDVVIETTKALTPAPTKKVVEAATAKAKAQAATAKAKAEAAPLDSVDTKPAATDEGAEQESLGFGITTEKEIAEEAKSTGPEALSENLDFIIRHASGKRLSEGEIAEANHYARKLKYPKGALVFNGTDEDDFLYCLPDNKEISVCREMAKSMGFPKLEVGLSAMSKDDLAGSLAYNSLKVQEL